MHALQHLIDRHDIFEQIHAQYGMPNIPVRPEGFETLCKIILEQQVSLESARACYEKLLVQSGAFTPENILELDAQQMRDCGLSRQKSTYVRALAEAIVSGSLLLETLSQKTPEVVRDELIQIKGIGHWTIDVYLMFSLQSPDIIPLGDIGILITIQELTGIRDKSAVLEITQNWAPYRSYAAFFLWHYYLRKRGRQIIL